jgi:pimeloyl-ACP methyl ester carboxylesterase
MERTGDRLVDFAITDGFETRFVDARDGTRLRVLVKPLAGRPRVVMAHGFPQNAACWRKVCARLEGKAALVVPDLRGFGASEAARSGSYDLDTLAGDLQSIEAATRDVGDAGPVILVAHDWGGPVAWRFVELCPELVRHHVSINAPHAAAYSRALATDPQQRKGAWYTGLFQIPGVEHLLAARGGAMLADALRSSSAPGTFSDEDIELYIGPLRDPARLRAALEYYRAARRRLFTLGKRAGDAARIDTPTTLVWGTGDHAIKESVLDDMAARICPTARVRRLEGVSHWVPDERPEACASAVLDALTS